MDQIKVLEEIGLKKVSDETHIEQKYIKYMVDCDFDKLNHINTQGFVKILSREYNLDLSSWAEAFEEYWLENRRSGEDNGLFIVVEDKKSSKKLLLFLVLIILVSTLSLLFSLFKDKIPFESYVQKDDITYEQTQSVKEAQKSIEEANETKNILAQKEVEEDTNQTSREVVVEDIVAEVIPEEAIEDINETKEKVLDAKTELSNNEFEKQALIVPNSELWVGVIYLDNQKRRSFLGEGNFSINLSRDQIITTGHGSLNINIYEETKEFNKQTPMRFLVRDGNISEISLSEFIELNRGKPW